jgi:CRISPR system Cascade subunit CasB
MAAQPKYPFNPGDESNEVLRSWWRSLEDDRGERAVLRRAASSTEAVFSPAYHRLLIDLQQRGYGVNREALAAVAGLAAHVREDAGSERSLAGQMAVPRAGGGGARVSELRFRRLLAVSERGELYPLLIRVIHLFGGQANLTDLANAVYWWNEKTRKQWAYDYYATAPSGLETKKEIIT